MPRVPSFVLLMGIILVSTALLSRFCTADSGGEKHGRSPTSSSHPSSTALAVVELETFEMFTTHDFPGWTPAVYFQCEGEKKHYLKGAVAANRVYNFSTHESFQPLAELEPPKCKLCGIYEEDIFTDPDIFDEWELCPLEFSPASEGGRLMRFKEKEFNITLRCLNCNHNLPPLDKGKEYEGSNSDNTNPAVIGLIVFGTSMLITFFIAGLAYWVREGGWPFRREADEDTRKFMQMFDEEDELLEDEEEDDLELEMAEKNRHD